MVNTNTKRGSFALTIIFVVVIGLSMASCGDGGGSGDPNNGGGTSPVTGVTLNKNTLSLTVGNKETLTATVLPNDAVSKTVSWSSSVPGVASVSSGGEVTGISAGSAVITVTTANGGFTASCNVQVSTAPTPGNGLTISPSNASVEKGRSIEFTPVLNGTNETPGYYEWTVTGGLKATSIANYTNKLIVSAAETAASLTVTATSRLDPSKKATTTVTVIEVSIGADQTFTSANEFGRWLSGKPDNTAETFYAVKLNVSSTDGIQAILQGEPKYVYLDLSGSTITNIPNSSAAGSIDNSFSFCDKLIRVTLPNTVTSIGKYAFSGLYSPLSSINIPDSVTSIGERAFYWTSLPIVNIPNSVTSIGEYAFGANNSLESVTIGSGITNISKGTFWFCMYLNTVTIPDTVTSIGEEAFSGSGNYYNGLGSITIGSGVRSIGKNAFANTTLLSVTFRGDIPESGFDTTAFSGLGDLRAKYLAGGPGTYTRSSGASLWYKQ